MRPSLQNQPLNWSSYRRPYALDECEFQKVQYAGRQVQNYIENKIKAKNKWKHKVVNIITSIGTFEQKRLVLHATLLDANVIIIASSLGVNLAEAQVHRDIVTNLWRIRTMA